MELSPPKQRELTVQEQQELKKLKTILAWASADGVISQADGDQVSTAMRADQPASFEELERVRACIHEKVMQGEVPLDYLC